MAVSKPGDVALGIVILAVAALVSYGCYRSSTDEAAHRRALDAATSPIQIAALILDAKGELKVSEPAQGLVTVDYIIDAPTGTLTRARFDLNVLELMPLVFNRNPAVTDVSLVASTELTDIKGHRSLMRVAIIRMSRKAHSEINWPGVRTENLPRLADIYWLHPALLKD